MNRDEMRKRIACFESVGCIGWKEYDEYLTLCEELDRMPDKMEPTGSSLDNLCEEDAELLRALDAKERVADRANTEAYGSAW